jgi:hypothetical protein
MKQALALLLLLPRERMQDGAYTPSGPESHARLRAIFGRISGHTGAVVANDRSNWLKMLVMGFQVACGGDDEIEIKKKEAAN